jgi:hypothetical protein
VDRARAAEAGGSAKRHVAGRGRHREAAVGGDFAAGLAAVILRRGRTDDSSVLPAAPETGGRRSAMAEKLVIELMREKETPGTVRFQEQDPDEDPKVGTLYVKKAASKRLGNPTRIRVTIEAIES